MQSKIRHCRPLVSSVFAKLGAMMLLKVRPTGGEGRLTGTSSPRSLARLRKSMQSKVRHYKPLVNCVFAKLGLAVSPMSSSATSGHLQFCTRWLTVMPRVRLQSRWYCTFVTHWSTVLPNVRHAAAGRLHVQHDLTRM
jgi:hypothetical protein